MSLYIYNDLAGKSIGNNLNLSFMNMYRSMERLSSGLKINSASDGPANLIISESLRAQIGSLNQKIENTKMLTGKYNTASSYVSQLSSNLTEMRTLAVAASNTGFNSETAQQAYQTEAMELVSNYNEIIENAEYNGINLFDGSEGSVANIEKLSEIDFSTPDSVESSMVTIENAVDTINNIQIDIGSTVKYDLEAEISTMEITRQNLIAAESNIRDTDFIHEYTNFITESIKFKAGLAILSHLAISSDAVLGLLNSR